MKRLVRWVIAQNNHIILKEDHIDGNRVTRISIGMTYWAHHINFITWLFVEIADRLSGKYGYRITLDCSR